MSSACVVIYHPHYIGNHEQSWCNLYKAGNKEISFEPLINIGCHRYSSALPSMKRVPQYRADIIAVLLVTFEVSIATFIIIIIWSHYQHDLSFIMISRSKFMLWLTQSFFCQLVLSCLDSLHEFLHPVAAHKVKIFTNIYKYGSAQGENIFKSKHLKGRLGPPVSHVTFFNQRRSVGAPRESRHVF